MKASHDLAPLIRFVTRNDLWRERLADVLDEHLLPPMEEFEVDFEDFGDILGDHWSGTLWGCGFEDFIARRFDDDGKTVIDHYLKRPHHTKDTASRAYMAGLRDAAVSLHEVSEVKPGESMVLRNLLTGDEPVTVREKTATHSLRQWDRIAVRVVPVEDQCVMSGAVLPFSMEASEFLFDGIRHALGLENEAEPKLSHEQLRRCAPIFTAAWLFTELNRALAQEPAEMLNSDGDPLLFHEVRFPLAAGVLQKDVAAKLNKVKAFAPEGKKFWNWLAPHSKRSTGGRKKGLAVMTDLDGAAVLGTLELKGKLLILEINSANRAELGIAPIIRAAGKLLRQPLTSIQTVEQMMAERGAHEEPRDEIPPEIAHQLIAEHLDRYYRDLLDQPVPALGDQTPREASRSASERKRVIAWLKQLENRSARQEGTPMAEYDFSWMWEELGLAGERQ